MKNQNKPKFLIADTIKGKGVKFMEHTEVMKKNKYYNWYRENSNDKDFSKAQKLAKKLILIKKEKMLT